MTSRLPLTLVLSLLVAFGGCATKRVTPEPITALEPLWKPLMESCPCPTPEFKSVLHRVVDQWQYAQECHIARAECQKLAKVDMLEMSSKVARLEHEADTWWKLPLVWAAMGILAGFGLGAGLMGL